MLRDFLETLKRIAFALEVLAGLDPKTQEIKKGKFKIEKLADRKEEDYENEQIELAQRRLKESESGTNQLWVEEDLSPEDSIY